MRKPNKNIVILEVADDEYGLPVDLYNGYQDMAKCLCISLGNARERVRQNRRTRRRTRFVKVDLSNEKQGYVFFLKDNRGKIQQRINLVRPKYYNPALWKTFYSGYDLKLVKVVPFWELAANE